VRREVYGFQPSTLTGFRDDGGLCVRLPIGTMIAVFPRSSLLNNASGVPGMAVTRGGIGLVHVQMLIRRDLPHSVFSDPLGAHPGGIARNSSARPPVEDGLFYSATGPDSLRSMKMITLRMGPLPETLRTDVPVFKAPGQKDRRARTPRRPGGWRIPARWKDLRPGYSQSLDTFWHYPEMSRTIGTSMPGGNGKNWPLCLTVTTRSGDRCLS
jgi:hypothetical protein